MRTASLKRAVGVASRRYHAGMAPDLLAFCSAALDTHELNIAPRLPVAFQSNALYDVRANGRHYIAKVYLKRREWDDAPHREYHGLKLVEPLDSAPQVIAMKAPPDPAVLYEYLPGTAWGRRAPQPGDLDALLDLLLRVQALHSDHPRLAYRRNLSVTHDYVRTAVDNYVAWCSAQHPAGSTTAALCARALNQSAADFFELTQTPFVPCFTKPDLRFANIIARPDGRLALVDWEDSMMGDPAFDLADLLCAADQEDLVRWHDWEPFWQRSFAAHKHDGGLPRRAQLYVRLFSMYWLTLVGKGVRLAQAGQAPHFDINGISSEQRLRRYLARALAPEPGAFESTLAALPETCFFPGTGR